MESCRRLTQEKTRCHFLRQNSMPWEEISQYMAYEVKVEFRIMDSHENEVGKTNAWSSLGEERSHD